jgi:hypothetical protein
MVAVPAIALPAQPLAVRRVGALTSERTAEGVDHFLIVPVFALKPLTPTTSREGAPRARGAVAETVSRCTAVRSQ